jgi:hypothetical protein
MEADKQSENNDEGRNEIISKLPLSKQFLVRQHLTNAESLSRDQAIEMLKESLVHIAYKDYTFLNMLKNPI